MFDIAVIGAGVVGGAVAREMTKYNLRVVILERESDVAMGATKANSAIVHAGFDAKPGTLKARLNVRGSELMEDYAYELGVKYSRCGSLVVGFNEEDRRTLTELMARGEENGVRELYLLNTREEVLKVEPSVNEGVCCALFAKSGAIICPYELCMAQVGCAIDNGAILKLDFEVCEIEKSSEGYIVSSTDGKCVEAKWVINCAGVYSDKIASLVGDESFTVSPRRGEYVLLDKSEGRRVSHTVFRCPSPLGKGVLVTPTVDGNLLIGPNAEDITDKSDNSTTAQGIAHIKRLAQQQVAGIDFSKTITSFAGLRATPSTGDFVIGIAKEGFINCAGIESPGLSSAPAIAEYAAELLSGAGVTLTPRADFSGRRRPMHYFRELADEEKNEIIKKFPEYAHIICRCEMISEGEILEAIKTNPRPSDIDGIKRRTRSGMGRCQGGFCSPLVAQILARELKLDLLEVTKRGGGSLINLSRTKGKK